MKLKAFVCKYADGEPFWTIDPLDPQITSDCDVVAVVPTIEEALYLVCEMQHATAANAGLAA